MINLKACLPMEYWKKEKVFKQLKMENVLVILMIEILNLLTWRTKICAFDGANDVRIPVDELHEFFKHPKATFAST